MQESGRTGKRDPSSVAIPVHYGSFVGKVSDGDTFAENVKSPIKVEFKIQF
jgi:hypothetical protein